MKILRVKQILFDCLHLRKRRKKSMENLKVFKGLISQSVSQLINPSIL